MLSKKRPVRLFPFIAGMLDGASHPTCECLSGLLSSAAEDGLSYNLDGLKLGFGADTCDIRNDDVRLYKHI